MKQYERCQHPSTFTRTEAVVSRCGWKSKAYLRRAQEAGLRHKQGRNFHQQAAMFYYDFLFETANRMTFTPKLFLWGRPFWSN